MSDIKIKVSFVWGLQEIILKELSEYSNVKIIEKNKDHVLIDYFEDFSVLKNLKSASRIYLILQDRKTNPAYVSNHKSVLSNLIEVILKQEKNNFKTYNISCAGSDSSEVLEIEKFIEQKFKLLKAGQADLKVHFAKNKLLWELGIQTTPRPISLKDYKIKNMKGAMDPTVAFSLNSLCHLEKRNKYLNVFSGSGTLMIEAIKNYPNLETVIGFDNNKEHLSISIQNIKKAGLIKKIQIKELDIFDDPNLGKFDVIVSDLPFGMVISKNEDLEKLYETFLNFTEKSLENDGVVGVYTSEYELFEKVIKESNFKIVKKVKLKIITTEEQFLNTTIFICKTN